MELTDNITVVADKKAKLLHIIIDYNEVIDYTKKANKEVFANAYYKKLNESYTLNVQLLGKKVKK